MYPALFNNTNNATLAAQMILLRLYLDETRTCARVHVWNKSSCTTSAHRNRRTKCSEIGATAAEHINVRDDLVDPSWGNESYLPKAEKLRGRGMGEGGEQQGFVGKNVQSVKGSEKGNETILIPLRLGGLRW